MRIIKNILASAGATALAIQSITPAMAQMAPGHHPQQSSSAAPAQQQYQPAPVPYTLGDLPRAVVLEDAIYPGQRPRAVSSENVRRDSPIVFREQFMREYQPRRGPDGELIDPDAETLYRIIAAANRDLCNEAGMIMDELVEIDGDYAASDQDYQIIQEIYAGLPRSLRRGSAVMTLGQAASTGALCALSLGLYCIAAIAGGVGNIFSNRANLRLQLANVRLSTINIRHSRTNIRHSRATVRLDALWLRAYVPYCVQIMPGFTARELPPIGRQDASVTDAASQQ